MPACWFAAARCVMSDTGANLAAAAELEGAEAEILLMTAC